MSEDMRWVGFASPVVLTRGRQAVETVVAYSEVLPMPARLVEQLRAVHGRAICDLTPRRTIPDMPTLPERIVRWPQ